jgi:hypothetical protein
LQISFSLGRGIGIKPPFSFSGIRSRSLLPGEAAIALKIRSSAAHFPKISPLRAPTSPECARWRERKPIPSIGSGQNQSRITTQAA